MNDKNLIVCTRCGRKYANYVNVYEFWSPVKSKGTWNYFSKHVDHSVPEDQMPPYIDRNLADETVICNLCILNAELDTLKDLPLEELPLLLNTRWLTEKGRALFKARLSGTNPPK